MGTVCDKGPRGPKSTWSGEQLSLTSASSDCRSVLTCPLLQEAFPAAPAWAQALNTSESNCFFTPKDQLLQLPTIVYPGPGIQ